MDDIPSDERPPRALFLLVLGKLAQFVSSCKGKEVLIGLQGEGSFLRIAVVFAKEKKTLEDREFQENVMLDLLISCYSLGQKGVKVFCIEKSSIVAFCFSA